LQTVITRRVLRECLLAAALVLACDKAKGPVDAPQTLSPATAAAVQEGVRGFMRAVARDVTRDGPIAWRTHFGEGPEFYMASEGALQFQSGAAAAAAIQELPKILTHVELVWGDDVRVDALTPTLAGVATSYSEVLVNASGERRQEKGFLTGTVEHKDGRWQFRNAHWSTVPPPRAATR
jgi:hypothetical protein